MDDLHPRLEGHATARSEDGFGVGLAAAGAVQLGEGVLEQQRAPVRGVVVRDGPGLVGPAGVEEAPLEEGESPDQLMAGETTTFREGRLSVRSEGMSSFRSALSTRMNSTGSRKS
jgi:hypothetical protein